MTSITLRLPLPPTAKEFGSNSRWHWHRRHGVGMAYKLACVRIAEDAVREAGWVTPWKARITLTFCYADRRKRDVDGCISRFKSGLDGLTLKAFKVPGANIVWSGAGVITDDAADFLEWGAPSIQRVLTKEDEGVRVLVEAVE